MPINVATMLPASSFISGSITLHDFEQSFVAFAAIDAVLQMCSHQRHQMRCILVADLELGVLIEQIQRFPATVFALFGLLDEQQ